MVEHEGFLFVSVLRKKMRNITLYTMNKSVDGHGDAITLWYVLGEKFRITVIESPISISFAPLFSSRTVL